jgi:uncharacterized protein YndB with AHSA1/START domain
MVASHGSPAGSPLRGELVIRRVLDAPREAVWKAWTEPARFVLWWGPNAFTAPACRIDLRAGGKYLHCMRSPEGQDYWSTGVYREIVPLERIVCTYSFADAEGNVVAASYYGIRKYWPVVSQLTLTLEEEEGRTPMTLCHDGIPPQAMAECEAGWSGTFDKLAEYLAVTFRRS